MSTSSRPGPGPEDPTPAGPDSSSVPRPSGLVLSPFRALRYDPAVAGELRALTSPPYDVVDADGVRALEARSDHNVVRLILPREDGDGRDRYARAAALLTAWREEGALVPDPERALYVYEQASPTATASAGCSARSGSPRPRTGSCCRTRTRWPGRSATA